MSSRYGPNYHPSHRPAPRITFPRRTREGIAARNRAWRELRQVLPELPDRWMNAKGEVVERGG